ncbi:microtubule-associated protein 9 [Amia ocellicauda]|uniref:microtubule-associated protein 9 n=1 Tax=Amia ocellicauda TaxID=2972642 RepID=UPI00346448A3
MADGSSFSTTLAYSKSPKVSKRTTFQDELQAAISARTARFAPEIKDSYSEDFEEDDDDDEDILKELLNSRKKRSERARAGKKKHKINDFALSDDEEEGGEEENTRPKRVSFLKTRRKSPPARDEGVGLGEREETEVKHGHRDAPSRQSDRDGASRASGRTSPWSDRSAESPQRTSREEDKRPAPRTPEADLRRTPSAGSPAEEGRPRPQPRPRQRQLRGGGNNLEEDSTGGGETSQSRPTTSSVSIPLSSTEAASRLSSPDRTEASRSHSPQRPDEFPSISSRFSRHPSSVGDAQLSDSLGNRSPGDSAGREWFQPQHSREEADGSRTCSSTDPSGSPTHRSRPTPTEPTPGGRSAVRPALLRGHGTESTDRSREPGPGRERGTQDKPDCDAEGPGPGDAALFGTRPGPHSARTRRRPHSAQSRYLGTLRLLDQTAAREESRPEGADGLRASIYQEWLRKKTQRLQETLKTKRQEDKLREEKKYKDEQNKREEAKLSFAAWKEKKKEVLLVRVQEKLEEVRKQEKDVQEKEERKELASKAVFEKWKEEKDEVLKEKYRQRKQAERGQQRKEQQEATERKRDSSSAFVKWNEAKTGVIQDKVKGQRRQQRDREAEERYEREERDRLAVETYEKWLVRKERQQKRERKQKKIQAILQYEAPPPWSPPNKTIPFGK